MNTRRLATATVLAASLTMLPALGLAGMTRSTVVRLDSEISVAAPPVAVWAWVAHGKNLVTWCPVWKAPANARVNLTRVGDVLDYSDEWGNGGRSIVTYVVPNKEIRVAHEPTNGSYICQAKMTLAPSGRGTVVHYYEQYSDDSVPKDLEATAQKMQVEMNGQLASLKKGVERK